MSSQLLGKLKAVRSGCDWEYYDQLKKRPEQVVQRPKQIHVSFLPRLGVWLLANQFTSENTCKMEKNNPGPASP